MCHASLEPRYLMRETEARVAALSQQHETKKEPAGKSVPKGWLRALLQRFQGKEATHV